jgi:hypothetical protein
MLEFVECRGNVVWHGEINGAIGVVPVECEATVEAASPVGGDCVKVFEGFDEMPCVLVTDDRNILHQSHQRRGKR